MEPAVTNSLKQDNILSAFNLFPRNTTSKPGSLALEVPTLEREPPNKSRQLMNSLHIINATSEMNKAWTCQKFNAQSLKQEWLKMDIMNLLISTLQRFDQLINKSNI